VKEIMLRSRGEEGEWRSALVLPDFTASYERDSDISVFLDWRIQSRKSVVLLLTPDVG